MLKSKCNCQITWLNWLGFFISSTKMFYEQVSIFYRTLINIFSSFIPNKVMTSTCKNGIYEDDLKNAISEVSVAISRREDEYYNRKVQKLSDPSASCKIYWFILKWFYNGKNYQLFYPLSWSIISCILCFVPNSSQHIKIAKN